MKFMIIAVVFCFLETWYFGFNMEPSCDAERWCDLISFGLFCYGLAISPREKP